MSNSALAKKDLREPTGAITAEAARIRLEPLGTPLRAQARAHSDGRLVLEAELPWLQLGANCTAELSDGRCVEGSVHWIGLDMTRSGTARLRILVNTDARGKSIQLSVSDADVQELMPLANKPARRRFRWMIPILTAGLAAAAGWMASHLLTPRPQLLAAPEAAPPAVERVVAAPQVVKIPAESIQLPTQEMVFVMTPTAAPAAPALVPLPSVAAAPEAKPVAVKPPAKAARKIIRKHR
jgi:hypothetical protein